MKEKIKKELKTCSACIDIWTGGNGQRFLGIVGSFISSSFRLITFCISLVGHEESRGPFGNETIKQYLQKACKNLGFPLESKKLLALVGDSGSNILACQRALSNLVEIRFSCFSHGINRSVWVSLYDADLVSPILFKVRGIVTSFSSSSVRTD